MIEWIRKLLREPLMLRINKGGNNMKFRKLIILAAVCVTVATLGAFAFAGCGASNAQEVMITGSTSVTPLMEKLAEAFEAKNQDVTIQITGSGSSQGIADAQKGACDIGMSSRALKDEELETLESVEICKDGIAIIVNKDCELTNVTSAQVYGLYADGTAIGSVNTPVNRSNGSGTRDGFNELIKNENGDSLKELKELKGETQDQTGSVIERVAGAKNVMGYISLGSLNERVKAVSLDGVAATVENIKSGEYKLQRPFVLAIKKGAELSDAAQRFLDFVQSEEGKKIIAEYGCIV